MPDDLYERDILEWSERQADPPRRVAGGERVNGVDWPHVIQEITGAGGSEPNAVRSHLRQAMVHLLTRALPDRRPWSLDDLLAGDRDPLLAVLRDEQPAPGNQRLR